MASSSFKAIANLQRQLLLLYNNKDVKAFLGYDDINDKTAWKQISFDIIGGFDDISSSLLFNNNFGIDSTINNISNNTLNIGANNAQIINIGSSSVNNLINIGVNNNFTTINIGDINDIINISGELNVVKTTNTEIQDKLITINGGSIGNGTARNSGIQIRDNNINNQGYIMTNSTGDGFLFKSPENNYIIQLNNSTKNCYILTTDNINNIELANPNSFLITNDDGKLISTNFLDVTTNDLIFNPEKDIINNKIVYYDINKTTSKRVLSIRTINNNPINLLTLHLNQNTSYLIKFNIICKNTVNNYSSSFSGSIKINQFIENSIPETSNFIQLENIYDNFMIDTKILNNLEINTYHLQVQGLLDTIINWNGIFKIISI